MLEKVNTNFHFPAVKYKLSISRRSGQYILELIKGNFLLTMAIIEHSSLLNVCLCCIAGHETTWNGSWGKKYLFSPGGKVIVKSLTPVKFRHNCETYILQFRCGNWKETSLKAWNDKAYDIMLFFALSVWQPEDVTKGQVINRKWSVTSGNIN